MGLHSMIREAKDPLTPLERLEELSTSGDREILGAVAENPATTLQLLERMTRSRNAEVLRKVGKNPLASPQLLAELVTIAVQYAPSPEEWEDDVMMFEFDEDKHFLALELASDPRTPSGALELLLEHPSRSVRFRLAGNPGATPGMLSRLFRDPEQLVRNRVPEHLSISEELASDILHSVDALNRLNLARNPSAPVWALKELALEKSPDLVQNLLVNPSTPLEVLETLREHLLDGYESREYLRDSLIGYLAGHWNATLELAGSLPTAGISENTLQRWYGKHPNWDTIRTLFGEWHGTLQQLVDSVEAIEAL